MVDLAKDEKPNSLVPPMGIAPLVVLRAAADFNGGEILWDSVG